MHWAQSGGLLVLLSAARGLCGSSEGERITRRRGRARVSREGRGDEAALQLFSLQ